ncbi:MAG: hypothetical protein HRT44_04770 [Bdellovibrionales bacterium]|nr:hypothetical protein [Bdellovibrionales bacterium]
MLARWIEKLLPHAVFGDRHGWGTAIPIEINRPHPSDPLYESKMADVKSFNKQWNMTTIRSLRQDRSTLIIFPAGQVAGMNRGELSYPRNVYDAQGSWKTGVLELARMGRADIAFAKIDSVNSEAFYQNRKRFGGGDKERVIWFFSEALAKRDQAIDVYLSDVMSLETVHQTLSEAYGVPKTEIQGDSQMATEIHSGY